MQVDSRSRMVVLGFNATLTAKVILYAVGAAYVVPGFLTPVLTQLFFPKPSTTFLTCFCRDEVDLRRVAVSEQWSLKAGDLLMQVVSNTGLTVHVKCKFMH